MNREALDKFFERAILAFILVILVFGPLAMGAVYPWTFLVIQGLTMVVMLLWALRIWLAPKPQWFWPPISWVVLAFAIYAIGRYLAADIEYVARQQLIQVLMYAFLFFVIVHNLRRPESAHIISFSLIFLGAGISGYAVYQFLAHSNHVWNLTSPYPGRGMGTYISPNDFAGFLEMILPLAVAYALVGRAKPLVRALLIYAAVAMMAGLVVTLSRGGWVAAAAGLLVLLIVLVSHRAYRLPALCLLAVLVAGGTIFTTRYLTTTLNYAHRISTPATFTQLDWSVRRDMWDAAVQMWRGHFWWGVGPGQYDYRFPEYRPQGMQMRPGWAHNDYLNLLADWGTVGGIIVLAGMIAFAAGLAKTWKYICPPENAFDHGVSNHFAFFLGASTGLLALAVHSVVDFNLHIPANAILGVTWLALLSSQLRFTERYGSAAWFPVRVLATLALVASIAYLGAQAWHRGHEQVWLARAESLPDLSPARVAALKKAFSFEPMNFKTAHDIGQIYRERSFANEQDYQDLARTAMKWYQCGIKLDRYDSYNYLGYGMCLDWLRQHAKAGTYFNRAATLDPNGYFTAAIVGWHYVQTADYAAAKSWLARSLRLPGQKNVIASSYLKITEQKLVKIASGRNVLPAGF